MALVSVFLTSYVLKSLRSALYSLLFINFRLTPNLLLPSRILFQIRVQGQFVGRNWRQIIPPGFEPKPIGNDVFVPINITVSIHINITNLVFNPWEGNT